MARKMKSKKVKTEKVEIKQVDVDVVTSDDAFLRIARFAHSQDITFNEAVNRLLREYIDIVRESIEMAR